ncbi:ATP-grasp domain-containing protein [Anaerobaca lacustris]|uniref:ATP-grasp domain-containing protein n=1 Tax=Anaerobaca lacustris TaxID=3044600 RepID=A0AAW6TS25_9BACT|nr:ATP-grasp domain-containing protein [Sedimentisphaerales bacterium M17dextr]
MAKTEKRPDEAVLFTCIGRRVSLLEAFREAARRLRLGVRFCGTDVTALAPALHRCDEAFLVEPTTHPRYTARLLSIVEDHRVRLVVPTTDLDLRVLARQRFRFEKLGCRVLISDPDVVDICRDKRQTSRFLRQHGFDGPRTLTVRSALAADREGQLTWPCLLKPSDGSAAKGQVLVRSRKELLFFAKRAPNAICQEWLEATEYTCDVYVDFERRVRCVVPRRRIEVRSGEVSKAQVVKDPRIMEVAADLVRKLGAGPGVITVQLFVTKEDIVKVIEVNPRFGGGAPLAIEAGADFPRWILQELAGKRPRIAFDGFQDRLIMLRYDSEVWLVESAR